MGNVYNWSILLGSMVLFILYMFNGEVTNLIISLWAAMFAFLFYMEDKLYKEVKKCQKKN